jgi:acyl carrier protein
MVRDGRTETIREILREHGRLAEDVTSLTDQSDLFEAGLTSHASVNLMLALEEHFQVEFSERMLQRRTFATIASIRSCLDELSGANA